MGMFLKPLRFKKRHHSREKKRKQADSRQQTGKTRKGNTGGASARPRFSAPQARGLFARLVGRTTGLRQLLCDRSVSFPALHSRHAVMPSCSSLNMSRSFICALFACSVPVSVNKHRDRDLKSICQRPHVIKGQTAFTTEDPADERFFTYLVFEIGL